MMEAGWRSCATPPSELLLGGLLLRHGYVGHCSRILDWTHGHIGEGKPIRGHAVDQQLRAPVVLTVIETESTVGLESRQKRAVHAGLRLAGVENVHGVFLVRSQKGCSLANTSRQKPVCRGVRGGCDTRILSAIALGDDCATG